MGSTPLSQPGPQTPPSPSLASQLGAQVEELTVHLRGRLWAGLFALLVIILGVSGLYFHARLPSRLPSDLDWQAAAALLDRDSKRGDAVALAPMWAERARQVLPARLPVMALPSYGPEEDLTGVKRVWLVSLVEAPGFSRTLEKELIARSSGLDGPQRLGALEITRYDLKSPVLPLAWLPDRLAEAQVRVGAQACQRDSRGVFRCPSVPPWVYVARQVREVNFLPRPCLWAHPNSDPAAPLTIELPNVPMGRVLYGHTGIVGDAMYDGNAPVFLEVKIDDKAVGTFEEPPRAPGWHPFRVDTTSLAGSAHKVTFTITTPDPARRHFCFEAMTL